MTQELKLSSQLFVVSVVCWPCCCCCLLYGFIYFSQVQPPSARLASRLVLAHTSIPIFFILHSPYSFAHSPVLSFYMFIPRSVLRYKLLFDAIALARTPVNLAQSLAQSRYLSTPLSLSLSSLYLSPSASLLFSLTLLYDFFRRSVAHCRLPLTLNFPAATDPCPLTAAGLPSLPLPRPAALFFFNFFFGRVKAAGFQKLREGRLSHTRKLLALRANCINCSSNSSCSSSSGTGSLARLAA